MPIQFRCPTCDRRLSIGTRKAGAPVTCPNCDTRVTGPIPDAEPGAPGRNRRFPLVAVSVGVVLALAVGVGAVFALKKTPPKEAEQARVDPPATAPAPPATHPSS